MGLLRMRPVSLSAGYGATWNASSARSTIRLRNSSRAHRNDGMLQEEFVTIREDRYVVPIVAGQKGRVDGVIHGSSGTGRTLFVEPLETISLNNQLVRLREDEIREIERILAEITGVLRQHNEEISSTAETLAQIGLYLCQSWVRGNTMLSFPGLAPVTRRLVLHEARHPLLESILRKHRKPIVPISFELDEQRRCLLDQWSQYRRQNCHDEDHWPACAYGACRHSGALCKAEFPLLDDVLADIGDAQSIAESLSSFSGHLLHVKSMLESVTPNSLVLLDELGRATDPEEGGALGVAILDEFRKSGAFCLPPHICFR